MNMNKQTIVYYQIKLEISCNYKQAEVKDVIEVETNKFLQLC